ncbi:uncharacterized protein LOC135927903 isoform X1 [Gordionus sp. m RMFG-2023]|uniref:uncharacterized protein LOC135927903 isoform X1 n=1 Tax=Gordionus sp. m RMFG-2023 TaxID=3053472 RepID=UPI0031FD0273
MDVIEKLRGKTFDLEEEKEKKHTILTQLVKESYDNMGLGLPSDFISKRQQKQRVNEQRQKPKNVVRIQKYYGDSYDGRRYGEDEEREFVSVDNRRKVSSNIIPELVKDLGKNEFYCQLCDVRMNGTQSFEAHTKGTKHFKKMKRTKENNLAMAQLPCLNFPTLPEKSGSNQNTTKSLVNFPPLEQKKIAEQPNMETKLSLIEQPLIGLQFVVEYYYEGDITSGPKYFCELCDKKCDMRTLEFHIIGYNHRWSYIKLKYTYYADEIREYGARKQDRTEAIEEYSTRIELEENCSRKIKKSMMVPTKKFLTVEDAMNCSGMVQPNKSAEKMKIQTLSSSNNTLDKEKNDGPSQQLDLVNHFLTKVSKDRTVDVKFHHHTHNYGDIDNSRILSPIKSKKKSRNSRSNVAQSWQVEIANRHILPQLPSIKLPSIIQPIPSILVEEAVDQQELREYIQYKRLKRKFDTLAGPSGSIPPPRDYYTTPNHNINLNRNDTYHRNYNNDQPNESYNNCKNINNMNQTNAVMEQFLSKFAPSRIESNSRSENLATHDFIYDPRPNLNSLPSNECSIPAHSRAYPPPPLQMISNPYYTTNNRFMRGVMNNLVESATQKNTNTQLATPSGLNRNINANQYLRTGPEVCDSKWYSLKGSMPTPEYIGALRSNTYSSFVNSRERINQKIDDYIKTLIKKGGASRRQ